jgi:hypothetical protein
MGKVRYFVVFSVALALVYFVEPKLEGVATWLQMNVLASRPSASLGIAASIVASLVAFFYVLLSQNRKKSGHILRYRWAEQALIQLNRMTREEILAYHASYNWHAYAGLGFSTLFIIVPLFFTDQIKSTNTMDQVAIFIGLGLLGISTVILGITDLFHTNTLTPLIPSDKRFELIDAIIKLGGLALMLQVCAIGVFLSLINSWLSVATSFFSLWLTIFITERRGVPIASLQEERQLTEEEAARVAGA